MAASPALRRGESRYLFFLVNSTTRNGWRSRRNARIIFITRVAGHPAPDSSISGPAAIGKDPDPRSIRKVGSHGPISASGGGADPPRQSRGAERIPDRRGGLRPGRVLRPSGGSDRPRGGPPAALQAEGLLRWRRARGSGRD